jgi:uncharacterized protein involved in outer membrane biogenesis
MEMIWRISRSRLKIIGIGLIVFFAIFTLFGFFGLPPILKSILTQKLSETLHREVSIEQIKVNPYTLSLTVRGFLLKERGGSEKFASFDELYINLQSLSALKIVLVLKEIKLKQPYLNVKRLDETIYNFSDLLEKKEAKPAGTPEEKSKPFLFSFNNIKIENGSIDFWDGPKQTKHTVKELNVGIPFLSNTPTHIKTFVQPAFSAKVNETPYVLQGKTQPFTDSFETTFDINIEHFDVPYYLAYLPLKLNFKIVSAYLDTKTQLSFIQYKDKGPSLTVSGNLFLKNVVLDDQKKAPLFRLPLLEVGIASSEPLKKIFHLSKISVQSPELYVQRNSNGALNIDSLLPEEKGAKPPSTSTNKEDQIPLSIDVDEVQLNSGKVSFSDFSKKKPFKTNLDPIELKVDHFSNGKDKKTAYALSFTSEAKEKFRLEGELSVDPLRAEGGLEIRSVPLKKYSPYYQDQILFNLEEGRLEFSTRFKYDQGEKEPEISFSGLSVLLNSLRLKSEEEKEDFVKIPLLSIKDTLIDITQKKVTVGSLSTEKGWLVLNRFKNGELDLTKLLAPSPVQEEPVKKDQQKEEKKPWFFALGKMAVEQYTVRFTDQNLSQPTTLTGEKIVLRGENISTAKNASGKLELSFLLDQTGTISTRNTISIDPLKIEGSVEVKQLVLNKYAPYYQDNIFFNIEQGDLDLFTYYQYGKTEKDTTTRLKGLSLTLKAIRLKKKNESEEFLNIPLFSIQDTGVDVNQKELSIGTLSTQGGALFVQRLKDGKLNLQTLFPEPVPSQRKPEGEKPVQEEAESVEKPWVVKLGRMSVDDYRIRHEDHGPAEPVTLTIDDLRLRADNLSTGENQKGNAAVSLRLNQRGTVSVEGPVGINPPYANLKTALKEIELKPFEPYFTEKVKVTISSGALTTTGNLTMSISDKKELKTTYEGEILLSKFVSLDKQNTEEILRMEALSIHNLHFDSSPLVLDIKNISLSNYYARGLMNQKGALNLQEIFVKEEVSKEPPPKKKDPSSPTPEKKTAETPKENELDQNIKIGTVTLQGGKIDFTDQSINPEYSTKLTELGGRILGLSSGESSSGDLELRGKLNDYAPLEITGKINPLKKDLYVDLKVRFKDIDLSPMTPYSGKYAGYTIQKGKLSLELSYLIDKRKLDSQNVIFLDQFNFGDKVESPQATKLPVKLVIALLKNRNGEIRLDLPVSGSLDDPKFNVWGIILKIILNLLAKAATSPFALLGAAFGGGEELGYIEFDYGMVRITETSLKKIDTLVKALSDRPGLKLDLEGHVDLERDREGLKQSFFQKKLKVQKLKEIVKIGQPAIPVDSVQIDPKEYERYLKLAYKEEKFPKPKNALGMAKDIPAPEMEKLMLTYIEVKESDLRSLAAQRAMSVKDAVLKSEKIEAERIFILEPKSLAPEKKEKLKDSRVELKLK